MLFEPARAPLFYAKEAFTHISRCLRLGGSEEDPTILDHAGDIYAAKGLVLLARRFWWESLLQGATEPYATALRRKLTVPPADGS